MTKQKRINQIITVFVFIISAKSSWCIAHALLLLRCQSWWRGVFFLAIVFGVVFERCANIDIGWRRETNANRPSQVHCCWLQWFVGLEAWVWVRREMRWVSEVVITAVVVWKLLLVNASQRFQHSCHARQSRGSRMSHKIIFSFIEEWLKKPP